MKKLLLTLMIICQSIFSQAGVISGGGGDTTGPIIIEAVNDAIINSKPLLKMLLNREKYNYENRIEPAPELDAVYEKLLGENYKNSKSIYKDLFKDNLKLEKYLEELTIDINTTGPCVHDGIELKDGSYNRNNPYRICISSFNLSKKLNRHNLNYEVVALIIHEIAHHFNYNEKDAERLQTNVVKKLKYKNIGFIKDRIKQLSFANYHLTELKDLEHSLIKLQKIINQKEVNSHVIISLLNKMKNFIEDLDMKRLGGGGDYLPMEAKAYHEDLLTRVDGVAQLTHTTALKFKTLEKLKNLTTLHVNHLMFLEQYNSQKTEKEKSVAKDQYNKIFLDMPRGKAISLWTFRSRMHKTSSYKYVLKTTKDHSRFFITKFNSIDDMYKNLNLDLIGKLVQEAQAEVRHLSEDKWSVTIN